MSSQVRKTYDTDVITLRRIFAVDQLTNTPISSGYILATAGSNGNSIFQNPFQISSIASLQIGLSTLSTTIGSGGGATGDVTKANLVSTVVGLGTAGYLSTVNLGGLISSPNLVSTVAGLGTAGYLSTVNLGGLLSSPNLVSTVAGLGTSGYISSLQLLSSFQGLPNIAVTKLNAGTGITITPVTAGEFTIVNSAAGGVGVNTDQLFSTVGGLGTIGYISSLQLTSTTAGLTNNILPPFFTSTVIGLGTANYISSQQLTSTTAGLTNNILPPFFTSTVIGLGTADYISSLQLTSTTAGLTNNILPPFFTSTVIGLGTAGYISSLQLTSTTAGLLTTVENNFTSTVIGLGTASYISTSFFNNSLTSSIVGLGTAGYISSVGTGGGGITDIQLISTMSQSPSFSTIRVGYLAGNSGQSNLAIAIGATAGYTNQGANSIAIGAGAGQTDMPASTIIISALGETLNTVSSGLYVAPLRDIQNLQTATIAYNSNTFEIGTINPYYIRVVTSTLGSDDSTFSINDVGKYFLFTQNTANSYVNMPITLPNSGWNCVVKNLNVSQCNITISTNTAQTVLAPGVTTTVVYDGSNFYAL